MNRPLAIDLSDVAKTQIRTAEEWWHLDRPMRFELTADQDAFVQKAIESGRFSREEEAVQEALALWERRERGRLEIIAMIEEAEASLARGEGREFKMKEDTQALAKEIKLRLRRRIAAENAATPGNLNP